MIEIMMNKLNKPFKGARLLVIDGANWWVKVYRTGTIKAQDSLGKNYIGNGPEIMGITSQVFERGQWEHTFDGEITPGKIVDWIRNLSKEMKSK